MLLCPWEGTMNHPILGHVRYGGRGTASREVSGVGVCAIATSSNASHQGIWSLTNVLHPTVQGCG